MWTGAVSNWLSITAEWTLSGIGTIRVGVRSVLPIEAGSRMVRLSQRFMVTRA